MLLASLHASWASPELLAGVSEIPAAAVGQIDGDPTLSVISPVETFDVRMGGCLADGPVGELLVPRHAGVVEFDVSGVPRALRSATLSVRVSSNGTTAPATLQALQADGQADLTVTQADATATAVLAGEIVWGTAILYSRGDAFRLDVGSALQAALDAGLTAVAYRIEIQADAVSTNITFSGKLEDVTLGFADEETGSTGSLEASAVGQVELIDGGVSVTSPAQFLDIRMGGSTEDPLDSCRVAPRRRPRP